MQYTLKNGEEIEIGWDKPGWDWAEGDFSWLSDCRLAGRGWFVHGGLVRHQRHIPYGMKPLGEFIEQLRQLAKGLEDSRVCWMSDTGGGNPGFWIEGERKPTQDDVEQYAASKRAQANNDRRELKRLQKRLGVDL